LELMFEENASSSPMSTLFNSTSSTRGLTHFPSDTSAIASWLLYSRGRPFQFALNGNAGLEFSGERIGAE